MKILQLNCKIGNLNLANVGSVNDSPCSIFSGNVYSFMFLYIIYSYIKTFLLHHV